MRSVTPNSQERLTFFSPSYAGDLDRLEFLRRSIRHFQPTAIPHIVAVPAQDIHAFRTRLRDDRSVEIIAQQDVVPSYFYPKAWYRALARVAPTQMWRFKASAGRPGWIVQQIVKLSIPSLVDSGPVAMVDSDLFFIRPFDFSEFGLGSHSRLLLRNEPTIESARHRLYMSTARTVLNLPEGSTDHHYMACPAIWYPDWVRGVQVRLEAVHGMAWQRALFEAKTISEYQIYGIFVEEILRPTNLSVRLQPFHHGVWDAKDFEDFLQGKLPSEGPQRDKPLTIVVQSNLGISLHNYIAVAERYLRSNSGLTT
jgi:hypothetical protein